MVRLTRNFLLVSFILAVFVPIVFAQEEITITTYYPSPYGSYNELQLYPHSSPTTPCNSSSKGTMYYDSDDNTMYVCNGTTWRSISVGVSFTYFCFTNSTYGTPVCVDSGGTQGYCPSGYVQKLALGAWGTCYYPGNEYFLPPGASCGSGCTGSFGGSGGLARAYICSEN